MSEKEGFSAPKLVYDHEGPVFDPVTNITFTSTEDAADYFESIARKKAYVYGCKVKVFNPPGIRHFLQSYLLHNHQTVNLEDLEGLDRLEAFYQDWVAMQKIATPIVDRDKKISIERLISDAKQRRESLSGDQDQRAHL
jgi:hypothetical protein